MEAHMFVAGETGADLKQVPYDENEAHKAFVLVAVLPILRNGEAGFLVITTDPSDSRADTEFCRHATPDVLRSMAEDFYFSSF